jgi:putative ABC transport system substrate-binding protein
MTFFKNILKTLNQQQCMFMIAIFGIVLSLTGCILINHRRLRKDFKRLRRLWYTALYFIPYFFKNLLPFFKEFLKDMKKHFFNFGNYYQNNDSSGDDDDEKPQSKYSSQGIITSKKEPSNNHTIATRIPRVVIVLPDSSPQVMHYVAGFLATIAKEVKPATLTLCDNRGNNKLFPHTIHSLIFNKQCDLIFTVGIHATIVTKKVLDLLNKKIPIVFGGVKDPVKLNLIDSFESSGNNLTGVTGISDNFYKIRAELLHFIKPNSKKVLILNDTHNPWGKVTQTQAETALRERDLSVYSISLSHKSEIESIVRPYLKDTGADTVFALPSAHIAACIQLLSTICNEHKITLLSSDVASVEAGAALSVGKSAETYGIRAANLAVDILKKGKHPKDLPISLFDEQEQFRCNPDAMKRQGLTLSENLLSMLPENGRVFRP